MLKNFRLIATVLVVAASSFGAVAQTETHKDVVLDGKPAKLNVKTGEVKLVELKTINGKVIVKDSTAPKTVIQANLITTTALKGKLQLKDTTTSKLDSLPKNIKPIVVSVDTIVTSKQNSSLELDASSKVEKATTLVYDTSIPEVNSNNDSNYHKVQKGETLYALSRRYNMTLNDLKRINGLETTLIKTGQTLRVKNFEALNGVWIVSKGDTLYSIAKRNNTSVAAIKTLNGLNSDLIKPGQKLQLK